MALRRARLSVWPKNAFDQPERVLVMRCSADDISVIVDSLSSQSCERTKYQTDAIDGRGAKLTSMTPLRLSQ
jgi:hypothetical protein